MAFPEDHARHNILHDGVRLDWCVWRLPIYQPPNLRTVNHYFPRAREEPIEKPTSQAYRRFNLVATRVRAAEVRWLERAWPFQLAEGSELSSN